MCQMSEAEIAYWSERFDEEAEYGQNSVTEYVWFCKAMLGAVVIVVGVFAYLAGRHYM